MWQLRTLIFVIYSIVLEFNVNWCKKGKLKSVWASIPGKPKPIHGSQMPKYRIFQEIRNGWQHYKQCVHYIHDHIEFALPPLWVILNTAICPIHTALPLPGELWANGTLSTWWLLLVKCAAFPFGGGGTTELTEHSAMAPDSSSATSSCNSSTPSSPAVGVYHLPSTSPGGLHHATRSADHTGHSPAFPFPGTCLVSVTLCHILPFFTFFSTLTLLFGWQEGHPACKNLSGWFPARCSFAYGSADVSYSSKFRPLWYWLTQVIPEKGPLNACSSSSSINSIFGSVLMYDMNYCIYVN